MTKRALFLAPHTDDWELGCGATVAKLIKDGCRLRFIAFSTGWELLRPGFPSDATYHEAKASVQSYGLGTDCLKILNYSTKRLPEHRQGILDELDRVNFEWQPDIIFAPSTKDTHQDHQTVVNEAIRVFTRSTLLTYGFPWNAYNFAPTYFVPVSEQQIKQKIRAVQCYRSQAHHYYTHSRSIVAQARYHGLQCGSPFAEAFEVIRCIHH